MVLPPVSFTYSTAWSRRVGESRARMAYGWEVLGHLPGKHDQSSHGKGGGSQFDSAASGPDAVRSVAIKPSGTAREALDDYGGEGPDSYGPINRGLRAGGDLTPRQAGHVAALDQAMKDSPGAPGDMLVYRNVQGPRTFGLSRESLESGDLTGLTWRDAGFVSTGTDGFVPGPTSVQMRILVPKGTKAVSYSQKDREGGGGLDLDEVLLDRGLSFRVVADHGHVDGPRRVDVEVMQ